MALFASAQFRNHFRVFNQFNGSLSLLFTNGTIVNNNQSWFCLFSPLLAKAPKYKRPLKCGHRILIYFIMGSITVLPLFLYFRRFNAVDECWIGTSIPWCRKQPLWQPYQSTSSAQQLKYFNSNVWIGFIAVTKKQTAFQRLCLIPICIPETIPKKNWALGPVDNVVKLFIWDGVISRSRFFH